MNTYQFIKQVLDRSFALFILLLLSPFLFILSLLLYLRIGSPIFFRQERAGYFGKSFYILKFRTMTNCRDSQGFLLPDEKRLTRLGRFLRATSLDELPELINILRGEMSFVGPRPLLVQYLPAYTPFQSRRHDVIPGLSGWAQINGRNSLTWEEKFRLDVWYVEHQSFFLDLFIFFATFKKILLREGISAPGSATMPPFVS